MKSEESTLYIHIPGTPTLLVVSRFLASETDSSVFTDRTLSPSIPTCVLISLHCMSSYRKVTNESLPPVAMMTWNVFVCNKDLIVWSSCLYQLTSVPVGRGETRSHVTMNRYSGVKACRLVREGIPHFTGRS